MMLVTYLTIPVKAYLRFLCAMHFIFDPDIRTNFKSYFLLNSEEYETLSRPVEQRESRVWSLQ